MNYENHFSNAAIAVSGLSFRWPNAPEPVLKIEQLQIEPGERIFIYGPSGSGKSTLLSLIAGVTLPQEGKIMVNGHGLDTLKSAARDRFRADHIGLIYQLFNLIPYLSVLENVTLPCRFSRRRYQNALNQSTDIVQEAMRLLAHLGLDELTLLQKPVTELSIGQQQRVAAARALIGNPEILIADEPTSSLDADLREAFLHLLFSECDRNKTTILFVSHDTGLRALFDRNICLSDINHA